MIDVHCRLLPGIDDGPNEWEESIAMARLAVANGITHTVATPHIHVGRWDNDRHIIARQLSRLRECLAEAKIPLQLAMAAEVRIGVEILPLIEAGQIPYLGTYQNQKVLLLELPHSHIPMGTERLVEWLLKRNILPMIAHPERNKDVMRKLDKIRPFIELGCLLQLTAGAIAGSFGEMAQRRAVDLLNMDAVFAIASDAHNCRQRPPDLEAGRVAACRHIGTVAANRLVHDNPRALTQVHFEAQV